MALTITVVLDARRLKQKTQNYPVKLRVTHDRITIDYQTVYDLTQEEFDRLTATRISNDLQLMYLFSLLYNVELIGASNVYDFSNE